VHTAAPDTSARFYTWPTTFGEKKKNNKEAPHAGDYCIEHKYRDINNEVTHLNIFHPHNMDEEEESAGILYNIIGSASINICGAQGIRVRFKKGKSAYVCMYIGIERYLLYGEE
jgi:hypothetical protein